MQDLTGFPDPQSRGRLVENDHLRAEPGRAGHRDRLALPARQGLHLLRHVLDRGDAQRLEVLPGVVPHAAGIQRSQDRAEQALATGLAAEVEIAGDVESRRHRKVLEDRLDTRPPGIERTLEVDPDPVD